LQGYPKGAAFARIAFHPDFATMRLHDHVGLEHADAQPFFLRTLKGAE
jgi:hypothetical protein